MSPEGFISALQAFNAVGANIYENGMPSIIGGQGQVRPRLGKSKATNSAPPASKYKVGDIFVSGNKHYKVTKINADGGVDADELK